MQFMICQQLCNPMLVERDRKRIYVNMFLKIIFSAVVGKFFVRDTFQRCLKCYLICWTWKTSLGRYF